MIHRAIVLGVAVTCACAAKAGATEALIDYPSFSNASDLTLVGSATDASGELRLTPASGGQGIGYVGIANSLTVEFDTWYNGSWGNAPYPNNDPSSSHVAIMSRGTLPNSDNHIYQLGTPATATAEPL